MEANTTIVKISEAPLSRDEQMQVAGDLMKDGDLMILVVDKGDGSMSAAVNTLYDDPSAFGIVLADLVTHLVGAYSVAGYSHKAVREAILAALGEELDFPSTVPQVIKEAGDDLPRA